jgi:hypothetical protein
MAVAVVWGWGWGSGSDQLEPASQLALRAQREAGSGKRTATQGFMLYYLQMHCTPPTHGFQLQLQYQLPAASLLPHRRRPRPPLDYCTTCHVPRDHSTHTIGCFVRANTRCFTNDDCHLSGAA